MAENDVHPVAGEPNPARRGLPPWLSLVLRTAITVGLMAYAVRDVRWSEIGGQLRAGHWGWWIAGLVGSAAVQAVAGIRWAALARPLGFDRPRRFFIWRFFEGMFFNLCLPSSIGGDVIKAYRVGDSTSRRLLAGCSILADRLTGLAALGVLACTALAASRTAWSPVAVAAVGTGVLIAVLAAFWIGTRCLDRIIGMLPTEHAGRRFIAQLLPYQTRPRLLVNAIGWSFIVQMGGALVVGVMARTVGVELGPVAWFSVVPLVALLTVLPVSIGGFGVRETAMANLLGHYGVPADKGVAVALLWSLSAVVIGLLGGLLFAVDRQPAGFGAESSPS
jgi:uncharacterized membrane protein YbhN (UPF0104 family)